MAEKKKVGPYCVIRTYSAGVHVGNVVRRSGKEVELSNARRIWFWKGANTLNEISLHGVGAGSKVSDPVASIVLTEAIEVIRCTKAAEKVLKEAVWAK
jgi:hypothetical protein